MELAINGNRDAQQESSVSIKFHKKFYHLNWPELGFLAQECDAKSDHLDFWSWMKYPTPGLHRDSTLTPPDTLRCSKPAAYQIW